MSQKQNDKEALKCTYKDCKNLQNFGNEFCDWHSNKFMNNERELADYIAFYLSETVDNLTDWDCEHLALNMLKELTITKKWK